MKMQTDLSPVDPKVEMLPQLCEKKALFWKKNHSCATQSASTLRWVGKYAGRILKPCMLVRWKVWQASLERKLYSISPRLQVLAVLLSKCKATISPDNQNAIYTASVQQPEALKWQYEPCKWNLTRFLHRIRNPRILKQKAQ